MHTPPVTLPNVVLAAPDIGIKYFSSGHSGAFPRIKWLIVVSALVSTGSIVNAAGPEVELKEKFGIWSLYCLKEAAQHCSITSGVYAKDNPQFWTKVAVTINSASGDLEMTVRTPVLKYFRNGVSLGFDGRQAVKGYIDTCSESSCESTITLNERLVDQIGTGEKMSIEYQVADAKGVVLVVDLGQIVPALRSLERSAGMRSDPMAFANGNRTSKSVGRSSPVRLVLERRKFELGMTSQAMATEAWKAPLKTCSETPTKKVVFVNSDLTVQNKMEMLDWAEKSSKCTSDAAVWIKQETAGPEGIAGLDPARLGSWTVYNFVSKVMPTGLVPGDDSRVAVLPRFSVESASKINPDLSGSSNLQ